MKRICILCLLAALLLGACGLPTRPIWSRSAPTVPPCRTAISPACRRPSPRRAQCGRFDAGELANVRDSFAKGSSNDYDITPKELDSRRIPESGCRVLEDYSASSMTGP